MGCILDAVIVSLEIIAGVDSNPPDVSEPLACAQPRCCSGEAAISMVMLQQPGALP
jgi:hypothetical protein